MQSPEKFANVVRQFLSNMDLPSEPKNLYEPIDYFMGLGGKRLRPQLALMACSLFDQDFEKATPVAKAIELFHNFSLIHDDIMDDAPLRRGKETVHEKWNENIGILSGDMVLIKAYQSLEALPADQLKEIFRLFNEVSVLVCEGQQMDMDFENQDVVSVADYIQMIYLKTSVLIEYTLDMGAYIGGANDIQRSLLKDFGKNLGIAFQLKDDYLDVFGNSEQVGKQTGGDIIANKKTFLLLSALEKADGDIKTELQRQLESSEFPEKKVEVVKAIFEQLEIDKLTEQKIEEYYQKAKDSFKQIEAIYPENMAYLSAFMEQLHARQY